MIPRPPIATPADTLLPYPTLVRSQRRLRRLADAAVRRRRLRLQEARLPALAAGPGPGAGRHGGERVPPGHAVVGRPPFDLLVELAGRLDLRARAGASSRSEEHTSELQSLMRLSYAVFCLKKK